MKIKKTQIQDFLNQSPKAIVGVSRKKMKFGRTVFDGLRKKGMEVIPVNKNAEEIDGVKCYPDIASLPDNVKAAVLITQKNETLEALKACVKKGINYVWIQQMSETKESLEYARNNNINLVYGKCIMMFSVPVEGIHKFHRAIMKLFGRLPK